MIQALTDEELAEEIFFLSEPKGSWTQTVMTEAARRSALAASQRAARGEQPLPMGE